MKPTLKEGVALAAGKRLSKWRAATLLTLAGIVVVVIFAASWAPESQMTKLGWVPGWIAGLADLDPNLRTAVPFIPLSFLLVLGFEGANLKRPLLGAVTVSGLCLCLSEFGQRFLPHRTADVKDLLWGGVGIGVGIGVGVVVAWTLKRMRNIESGSRA